MKLLTVGIAVLLALGLSSTGFATAQKNARTKLADSSSTTIASATNPVAAPKINTGAQTTPQAPDQGQAPTTQPQPQPTPPQPTNSQDNDDDSDKD